MSKGLKISNTFWVASALIETEVVYAMGCCIPCHLGNALSLFINFIIQECLVEVSGHFKSFYTILPR